MSTPGYLANVWKRCWVNDVLMIFDDEVCEYSRPFFPFCTVKELCKSSPSAVLGRWGLFFAFLGLGSGCRFLAYVLRFSPQDAAKQEHPERERQADCREDADRRISAELDIEQAGYPCAERIRARGVPTVVWGGAFKGVIFSLFMQRAGASIDCVVDINPAKQGRYLPATGLRVFSPKEMLAQMPRGADIYVMNSNYLDEIRQMTGNQFNYIKVDHDE